MCFPGHNRRLILFLLVIKVAAGCTNSTGHNRTSRQSEPDLTSNAAFITSRGLDDEHYKLIVDQMDQIGMRLEGILKKHEGTRIPRQAPPFGRRAQCTVTRAKLTELVRSINDALSNSNTAHDSSCELSASISDNCDELLKGVQCGVSHLQDAFAKAISSNSLSDEWKNKYKVEVDKLKRELDDQKQYLTDKHGNQIDELLTNIQDLLEQLRRSQRELYEVSPEVLAYRITKGGELLNSAINKFKELFNAGIYYEDLINKTVEKAYGLDHVVNILTFINELPWYSHRGFGFKKLYEMMEQHGQLDAPQTMIFSDLVQETMEMGNEPNVKQELDSIFSTLKNKLNARVNYILDIWSVRIKNNNDYQQIIDFCKTSSNTLRNHLPKLIEKAYTNSLTDIKNILTFIRHLPYIADTIIACEALFEEMKSHNNLNNAELVSLVYMAKELMEMENYSNVAQNYKDKLESLKYNFPSSVRRLIWTGYKCEIKNKHFNEYMYAANDVHAYDSWRRRVFTWRSGDDVREDSWLFNPVNKAESFNIKNDHWNEYFYAAGNEHVYDGSRRRVFTWRPGSDIVQDDWQLIPQNEYFLIYNRHYKEYLYAADYGTYDETRRRVFTWRESSSTPTNDMFMWHIDC